MRTLDKKETVYHYQRYVKDYLELDKLSKDELIERYLFRMDRMEGTMYLFASLFIISFFVALIFFLKYLLILQVLG